MTQRFPALRGGLFALVAAVLFGVSTPLVQRDGTLDAFNVFDRKVNDIEYFYESQLPGEAAPLADKHVHPAEPRTLRLTFHVSF